MKMFSRVHRPGATSQRRARPEPARRRDLPWLLLVATVAIAALVTTSGQSGPGLTTDHQQLLRRVRDNVARDLDTLTDFTYTLERRSYDVNLVGKVSSGDVMTYEVAPSPFEQGRTWRRLVAVNGQRLTAERLRKEEDKARQEAEKRRRARASDAASRDRDEREQERRARERLADVERVFQFTPVADREVDGHQAVGFEMTPRPDARPLSDVGKQFEKLRGQLWVDREHAQLLRADFEVMADITYGYGVIGRVSAGSRASYRRTRLTDGKWVPLEARFHGTGRTLMLIPFSLDTWAKYADFRRPSHVPSPGQAGPPPR